jgi:uncharacterized protein involved in exopolysaccharide biosynthesis
MATRSWRRRRRYYLAAPIRRPALLLLPAVLVGVTAYAIGLATPPRYRAVALVGSRWEDNDGALLAERGIDLAERRAGFVRQRLGESDVVGRLTRALASRPAPPEAPRPSEAETRLLLSGLQVRPLTRDTFAVEVDQQDATLAASIANGLAAGLTADDASLLEARVIQAYRELSAKAARAGREAPAAPQAWRAPKASPAEPSPPASKKAPDPAAVEDYDGAERRYQQLLEAWASAARDRPGAHGGPSVRFELLRAADVPTTPASARPLWFAVVGALAGMALGLLAALVAEHRDRSVKGPEDLSGILDAPLLATLPRVRLKGRED